MVLVVLVFQLLYSFTIKKKMFLLEREKEEKPPEISVDWIKGIAFQYAKHLGNWIFHILASCTGAS